MMAPRTSLSHAAFWSGRQHDLGINPEERLGLDRQVGEEILGIAINSAEPRDDACVGHARNTSDLLLVADGQIVRQAHVVADDQSPGTAGVQPEIHRRDYGLQDANQEDADRHRQHRAERADPILAKMLENKRCVLHIR